VTGPHHPITLIDLLGGMADRGIELVIRDAGLLESALARPQATVLARDAYPDVWTKAAAVMHSLIASHPFLDGNKRAGLAAALATLSLNGVDTADGDPDAVYTLTLDVARGETDDIATIAARLRAAIAPHP
jgi:death-on-curing protein